MEQYDNMRRMAVAVIGCDLGKTWNAEDVDLGRNGASEMMFKHIAQHFQEAGLQVYMIGNHNYKVEDDGTVWLPYDGIASFANSMEFECAIYCRTYKKGCELVRAKKRYLVVTDMGPWVQEDFDYSVFDGVFAMTEWHRRYLAEEYPGMDPDRIHVAPCCPDTNAFGDVDHSQKTNSMVWSSRFERGLLAFVDNVMPRIQEQVPDFKLYVCQYDDYPQSVYDHLAGKPGIEWFGKLSHAELWGLMRRSKIWVYLNNGWSHDERTYEYKMYGFHETFCSTGVENAMCGNAIICTNYGGFASAMDGYMWMLDWEEGRVRIAGRDGRERTTLQVLSGDNLGRMFQQFASVATQCLINEEFRRMMCDNAREVASKYDPRKVSRHMMEVIGFLEPAEKEMENEDEQPVDMQAVYESEPLSVTIPVGEEADRRVQEMLDNETMPGELLFNN